VTPCRFTISAKRAVCALCEQAGAESERSREQTRSGVVAFIPRAIGDSSSCGALAAGLSSDP
jgi:hypothetical protein